jgi:hypothetical protein
MFFQQFLDPVPGGLGHLPPVVEHPVHRPDGDIGDFRDILDPYFAHNMLFYKLLMNA